MRTIAPILLGLILSVAAFADDDPPAAPSGGVSAPQTPSNGQKNDLVSWCNANLKDQSAICTAAGSHVCSLDDSSGCAKPALPKPTKIDWGTSLDDTKLGEKSGDVEKTGDSLKSMAANCCTGSGSGCQLPADAQAAQDKLKSASDDSQKVVDGTKGALDSSKALGGVNTNGVAVAGGWAQMCEAAVFNCMQWANKTETDFGKVTKSSCEKCDAEDSLIKGYMADCSKSLTSSPVFGNLTSGQGAQKKIEDVNNKISSGTPSTGTPAAGTPSKGTGSGGGDSGSGDMSSMMKGLAQAAQAYMQAEMAQQQQTTPTTPATVPSAACSAASVGGACPATPATPTPAWSNGQSTLSQNAATTPAGGANVGNLNDQLAGAGPAPIPFTQLQPLSSGTVPGGGGGGSGLGGNTPGGATLGGGVPANYARGGTGVDTNIMHGEGGGGFSQVAAAMNTSTGGGGGGWGGYGREPASNNFDLKSFLPGGRNDPSRGLAGGNVKGAQIQSSQVNIWSRISDHIKARCSQGLLRDCVP